MSKLLKDLTPEQIQAYRKYRREWYYRNKTHARQKVKERQKEIKDWLSEYKSKLKCNRCDESFFYCLEFHHMDPSLKEGSISEMKGYSKKKILEEINKCEVLCSNCHRKEHYRGKVL